MRTKSDLNPPASEAAPTVAAATAFPAATEAALDILTAEAADGKLDRDLLDVFITKQVYQATAPR